jgi:DNA polymerase III subunit alpha
MPGTGPYFYPSMSRDFVHLHLHTQYSLLDGASKISEAIARAKLLGQPAIAMTDHGNLHGAIEFYQEAKKQGIKPIIGCELYVTPHSRFERKTREQGGGGTYHLTALASNLVGYRNLCRLVSLAYRDGFYFKPRVDHSLLTEFNEGIILLSGCLAGELNGFIEKSNLEGAKQLLQFYATTYRERFFLEVQPHAIAEQIRLNTACVELAHSMGIPTVATTDCHYCEKEDHYAQEVLMCISMGKTIHDPTRIQHKGVHLHLKSGSEMVEGFGSVSWAEAAVAQSVEIASRCDLSFDFNTHYMPRFSDANEDEHLTLMALRAREGLTKRLLSVRAEQHDAYWERLEREISLIGKMGFGSYFLVVSDFIVWAKEHEIPVGPGRGSVAGSLVAFALRITDVDPIFHVLLFERFLNPERVSLPDIDVDFCIYGRQKVIQYVVEKYGKDKVAQIATFGKLKAKAAVKDVGRALGKSYGETDRIAQLIPAPRQGFDFSLSESIKLEPRLAEYAAGEGKELISLALKLEGLTRHSSTHAAGVVIGDRPLMDLLPMMVDKDGNDVTQYSMSYVEKCGLVKFDFLGLKTLTVIHTALRLIKEDKGISIEPTEIPLDDARTLTLISQGKTTGVFQLESPGITEMTIRLRPSTFGDLVAILALYRPGPLDSGMADRYIERKHGREPVSYLHPKMSNVLSNTYGIMLYQEQIMQLARELAGYSLAEADILRKAMGKKDPIEMGRQKTRFLEGAMKEKISSQVAEDIFSQMETFARYGFNKSHSVAYALVSYQTAFLKAHYPVEFMAALMSHEMDDSDKTLKNLNECKKSKIKVLPPHINFSDCGFTVEEGKVRFGLEAVKGLGQKVAQGIVEERTSKGLYTSLEDFCMRGEDSFINRRVVESLIKCGACDILSRSRRDLFEGLEQTLSSSSFLARMAASPQMSLFSGVSLAPSLASSPEVSREALEEWPALVKLGFEKEALGFYISGHPLDSFSTSLKKLNLFSVASLKESSRAPDQELRIAGVVTGLKAKNTKKGDRYASFVLEDPTGTIEAVVWPDSYKKCGELLELSEPLVFSARAEVNSERALAVIQSAERLVDIERRAATKGIVYLKTHDTNHIEALIALFSLNKGHCPVYAVVDIMDEGESIELRDSTNTPIRVAPTEFLLSECEKLFGRPALKFL